jgi:hypothetical protein
MSRYDANASPWVAQQVAALEPLEGRGITRYQAIEESVRDAEDGRPEVYPTPDYPSKGVRLGRVPGYRRRRKVHHLPQRRRVGHPSRGASGPSVRGGDDLRAHGEVGLPSAGHRHVGRRASKPWPRHRARARRGWCRRVPVGRRRGIRRRRGQVRLVEMDESILVFHPPELVAKVAFWRESS